MNYQTINVKFSEPICFIQINRPEANNTINDLLIKEFSQVLKICDQSTTVVVIEGLPEVFCFGADFQDMCKEAKNGNQYKNNSESLYNLWLKMITSSFVIISCVRGKVNAGGIGFIAASDIVIADQTAQFSLSELLFGLFPACVMPFLIRKIGFQKANYMTLMTQPIQIQQAFSWGLVDAYDTKSESLLRKHLLRLKYLSKNAIFQYKQYMNKLYDLPTQAKTSAVLANIKVFSDTNTLKGICRYVETGQFPWED